MEALRKPAPGKSISVRLFLCTLAGSLLLAVAGTGIHVHFQYRSDIRRLESTFDLIEKIHVPAIAGNLFAVNDAQIALQLHGLLNFPGIAYAEVREEKEGYTYQRAAGTPDPERRMARTFELRHPMPHAEAPLVLGVLDVAADPGEILRGLRTSAMFIALSTFAQVFVVAVLVFLALHVSVARHLAGLAEYTDRLDLSNLDHAFRLSRKRWFFRDPDEIDRVAEAFDRLRIRLREDIEQQERVQRRLTESEARFRSLTDNLPIGVFRISPEKRIRFANPAMARMFGFDSPDEMEGSSPGDFYANPKDRRPALALYEGRIRLGPMEIPYRRKDGSVFHASLQAVRFEDPDGRLLSVDGTLEDITARKEAESAVRKRNRELETLYRLGQSAADGFSLERALHSAIDHVQDLLGADMVLFFLRDGESLRIKAHSRLVSGTPDFGEIHHEIGRCLCGLAARDGEAVYSRDIRADARCVLEECRETGLRSFAAIPLTTRNENIGVMGVGSMVETDFREHAAFLETAGRTIAVELKNILLFRSLEESAGELARRLEQLEASRSAEKSLAEQKTILERQLRHAQKMEAIGTLTGGIAHDFNNILGGIVGFGELAAEYAERDPSRLPHFHGRLLEACARARELVEQILKFGRQRSAELQTVPLTPLVKETVRFLRATLPSTVEIAGTLDAEPDRISADPGQIHQVLVNLCTNAFHAMRPGGGRLALSTENVRLTSERRFQGQEIPPGDYALLAVSDTGKGIPAHFRERIFEPYFTTKTPDEGSGLGLSVSLGIVRNHGGLLEFESREDAGTTFRVYLPVSESAVPEAGIAETRTPSGNGQRLMVVDDELFFLDVLREHLESLDYDVIAFQDSAQALRSFAAHPGHFDLAITDQTMPKLTGIELIERIREIRPEIPIVLCTGFSETPTDALARNRDITRFLMKPVNRATLAVAVRDLLVREE